MATKPGYMIFLTQAPATAAATSIANKALTQQSGASTVWLNPPFQMTADPAQRWAVQIPKDESWMADVDATTYVTSTDVGLAPVGEGGVVSTVTEPLTFRDKLTHAEKTAITCAATKEMVQSNYTSAELQIQMDDLNASGTVGLDTARMQGGVAGLVAAGFIDTDRANAILAPVGVLPSTAWK